MWGYDSNPWIREVVRDSVTVNRVKEPAEPIEVPNEEDTLWRYMDFVKLLALLQNNALYFSRVDKLGDQFEGRWSDRTIMMLHERHNLWRSEETHQVVIEDRRTGDRLRFPKEDTDPSPEDTILRWQSYIRHPVLSHTYVNCWHSGEDESESMWKLYAGGEYGVAIRTTAAKLVGSFTEFLPDYFGQVKYVSYDRYAIPVADLPPVFYKRSAFGHEKEVRAVLAPSQRDPCGLEPEFRENGLSCPAAPDHFIEEIVLSPYGPAWLRDVIQGVLRDLNLDIGVRDSVMMREPLGSRTYLTIKNLKIYFAYLMNRLADSSPFLRIWALSREDAFKVAREKWNFSDMDTSSFEVLTREEYLEDYGCLPEHFESVPNRFNSPFQNSLDPDLNQESNDEGLSA